MSAEDRQQLLVGDPDGTAVHIETSGRIIRPLLAPLAELVDEAKLRFTDDGLSVRAVDPANVAVVAINAYPQAFERYDPDADLLVGTNLNKLTSSLSSARMGKSTDDPVELTIDQSSTRYEIERDYGGTRLTKTATTLNIDPDSIRQEPDVRDLDLDCSASVSPRAFKAAAEHVDTAADHLALSVVDGHLVAGGTGDSDDDSRGRYDVVARFDADVDGDEQPDSTLYSLDYIKDMACGIRSAKADELTLAWSEEFPARLTFARHNDDGDVLYDGEYVIAPRIKGGDD